MTKKILKSILLVSVIVLFAGAGLTMGVLYHHFGKQLENELQMETSYLALALEHGEEDVLESLPSGAQRVTYIDKDGTVLFDNLAKPETMENHKDREEVQEALDSGYGKAVRRSDTLSKKTLYYAVRLTNGNVIRVSSTQYNIPGLIGGMVQPMLYVLLLAAILSVWMAYLISKRVVEPINRLDLDHPEDNQVYDEVAPLLTKINRQQKALQREAEEAKRQQEEFSIITENMEEGFLVIDRHTEVLSYNSSALKLLGADKCDGRSSVLTLNRSEEFQNVVEGVLSGYHMSRVVPLNGGSCQIAANPVFEKEKVTGAVIVIMDVTERMKGEQMRREFTANVSHELKTPLTSISGFAEIIRDGYVRPEDTKRFAGNIFKESQRLISLVNDIIKISQMDEGKLSCVKETVDVYEEVRDIFKRLEDRAQELGVHLYLYGSHAKIDTVKMILEEILYNLCDNGLKYNKEGGSLTVTVSEEDEKVQVIVEDTGIGIPQADKNRIFERFYRVDKSHSKAIGGTGLGLSIVKHGCMYLGAEVTVDSVPNEGSKFILTF